MKPFRLRIRSRFCLLAALAGAAVLSGCGGHESEGETATGAYPVSAPSGAASNGAASNSASGGSAGTGTTALVQAAVLTPRKIIYTSEVDLVVENLSASQEKLARLVRANGGYIADASISGQSGEQRSGTWKARVPVERYEAFMAGATRLGELQSVNSKSQDVTAEYTDVASRIANKQIEEKRLRRHLEDSTGKLSEILVVERELSRVRGEIEEAQGRIRVLANLSALTTITVTLNEIKNYVPPSPPTFGTQVARAFTSSLDALREAFKAILLVLVALAPWLVVAGVLGLPARLLWRRFKRPSPPPPPTAPPQPPLAPPPVK